MLFKKTLSVLISLLVVFVASCQKSSGASLPTHVLTADYGDALEPSNPTYQAKDVQWVSLVEVDANYRQPSYFSVYRTAGTQLMWYTFTLEVVGGSSPENPYYTNLGGSGSSITVQPSANFAHDCNGDLLVSLSNSSWLVVNWALSSTATDWLNSFLNNPTYSADYQSGDYWFFDGPGTIGSVNAESYSVKDAVTGASPDYPCVNGSPVTTYSAWDADTRPALAALGVNIITDEGGQNPDHIGSPFVGQRREDAYTGQYLNTNGPEPPSVWVPSEDGEIRMANANAVLLVQNSTYGIYPTSSQGQADRLFAYASFLLTYNLNYSYYWFLGYTAGPDSDPLNPSGERIFPEEWFVPTQPVVSEPTDISQIQDSGGAYYREYTNCGYQGNPLGRCAIVVNPSTSSVPWPSSLSLYLGSQAHQMVMHNGNGTSNQYCTVVSGSQPCTGAEIEDGGYLTFDGPPAPSIVPAQSAVIVYSPNASLPPPYNSPGVAATGSATQLAAAVSGSSSPQTIQLNSSLSCNPWGFVQVMGPGSEITPILSIPSSNQITATLQNNHPLGADVICSLGATPHLDSKGQLVYNPLYGMTTYAINITGTTAWTQIGPNGVVGKLMYVDVAMISTANQNTYFGFGSGSCSSPSTVARYTFVSSTDVPHFNFVVPAGDVLCFEPGSSSLTTSGYINVLQE